MPHADFIHIPVPQGKSPISRAVGVPPGATTYYLSGQMPTVVDPAAPADSRQAYGDTRTQTRTTLERLDGILRDLGMSMRNVVHVRACLVADPDKGNRMDFEGFNAGYADFFASQPDGHPARMVYQVAGLVNPGWLLEIEAMVAR